MTKQKPVWELMSFAPCHTEVVRLIGCAWMTCRDMLAKLERTRKN